MKLTTRRRNAMLASLVLFLGVAIFANWYYSGTDSLIPAGDSLSEAATNADSHNLGDAVYVNSDSSGEYFSGARLSRDESYDKTVSTLEQIMQTSELDEQSAQAVFATIESISDKRIMQSDIESLVKAKTGSDCVCVLSEDSAEVIVSDWALNEDSALQIKEIVTQKTKLGAEKISIIGVK